MEKDENKLPPIVPEDIEDDEPYDFESIFSEQSATIKKQEEQISKLLEAVKNMTKAGANYQQGEPPKPKDEPEEDPYKDVKPLAELDFKM